MKKMIEATVCDICGTSETSEWKSGKTQIHGLVPLEHDLCAKCVKDLSRTGYRVILMIGEQEGKKPKRQAPARADGAPPPQVTKATNRPLPEGWEQRDGSTFTHSSGARVELRDSGKWYGIRTDGTERLWGYAKGEALKWAIGGVAGHPLTATVDRMAALRAAKTRVGRNAT